MPLRQNSVKSDAKRRGIDMVDRYNYYEEADWMVSPEDNPVDAVRELLERLARDYDLLYDEGIDHNTGKVFYKFHSMNGKTVS